MPPRVTQQLCCALVTLCALAAACFAQEQKAANPPPDNRFVLSTAQPLDPPDLTLEELAELWPVLNHEPFDKSGFNHLTLPFQVGVRERGTREEALALSFLISNALDWVPGCYCARHAYFVFKRAKTDMLKLAEGYDPALIKAQIKRWRATHAIGGRLDRTPEGYTGKLVVFDPTGKTIAEKTYEKPRAYFDLLGDMCCDFSVLVGHKPSPALKAHFALPRCKDHQSIIDLGSAAFAEERSGTEFSLYRHILERDPGFAEVRYWMANQAYWDNDNADAYNKAKEQCLASYVTEAPLGDLVLTAKNADRYKEYIAKAEALVGENSPVILSYRLHLAGHTKTVSEKLIRSAFAAAARYPNQNGLLCRLCDTIWSRPDGLADADAAVALVLARLGNNYMRGSAWQTRYAVRSMAHALMSLGRSDVASTFFLQNAQNALATDSIGGALSDLSMLGLALRRMGRYGDATGVHIAALKMAVESKRKQPYHLANAIISAALASQLEVLDSIGGEFTMETGVPHLTALGLDYMNLARGGKINKAEREKDLYRFRGWYREILMLLTEADLAAGTAKQWERVEDYVKQFPNDREFWVLFDAYQRKNSLPDAGLFYESLSWLHGHDPWVRQATAAYRKRAKKPATVDIAAVKKAVSGLPKTKWPTLKPMGAIPADASFLPYGSVAMAARTLIDKGQHDQAMDIVLRYKNSAPGTACMPAMFSKGHALRVYCNHLLHLIEASRKKKTHR